MTPAHAPSIARPSPARPRIARLLTSRWVALVTALAFAISSLAVVAGPARAWAEGNYSSDSESLVISLQNQARASAGLRTLKLDSTLRSIARWRSEDMADRNYLSHTVKGTSHEVFWYMQYKYDYCFKVAGENIGTVTWPGASESDVTTYVFNEWMKSKGHRANIMGKAWDVVGVGAIRWTEDKYVWTVLFADKCGSGGATPKPTAKPTPKPTPKPTKRPTPKPTAQRTAKPTPKPTPKPRRTPKPTKKPTSSPSPSVPLATAAPTASAISTPAAATPSASPSEEPTPVPIPTEEPGSGWTTFAIVDRPVEVGLVDSILNAIAAQYFGR